ncbi:hypothetical protein [Hyphobacterium sp.]|uniref:hypothetical protein n=1 Tax=Hyphobacterium sp. TaxID=2004662 RepID=UPI003BA95408
MLTVSSGMDLNMENWITLGRWYAAISGIVAAFTVAHRPDRKWMVAAFALFLSSSATWVVTGLLESDPAIAAQNFALSAINAWGVYRWARRKDDGQGTKS